MAAVAEIVGLEPHPLCSIFPDMSPAEYADLMGSIREHGLLEPVVLWEGKILDGRHRYRACGEVGVEPRAEEYRGQLGSPEAFVAARNLHHRNLSASQRATIGVDLKKSLEGKYKAIQLASLKKGDADPEPRFGINTETGNDSRKEAAEAVGVSEKYISDAERIQEASPETFADVKAGKTTITKAKKALGIGKPKAKPEPDAAEPEPNAIVNGVPAYDEGVARLKAAGRIPEGVQVVVDAPAAAEPPAEESAAAAEPQPPSDEEWLATLPLSSKLSGVSLRRFQIDALHYRGVEVLRKKAIAANSEVRNRVYKGSAWKGGAVQAAVSWWFRMEHPKDWHKCPPTDKGGCDGVGTVPIIGGDCTLCKGRGYLAR